MSKKYFTEEEINELKKNPYVKNVTEKGITYTQEFREEYAKMLLNGKHTSEIFYTLGFDTKVLGEERIYSTTQRIRKMIKKGEGFEDTRRGNSGRKLERELSLEEQLNVLKHKNLILEQENSFLKKMIFLKKKENWMKSQLEKDI